MIKNFLFNRPAWFVHEGWWRLAQVLRLGPMCGFFIGALVSVVAYLIHQKIDFILITLALFAFGIASIIGVHLLLRLIVWIIDGFTSAKKAA